MSEASYSVGNRVYNGASNAPTRGTVDPSGYIDRELNKPSQSRSGLAQAALRRINGGQPVPQPQTPVGPPPDSTPGIMGPPHMGGPPASLMMSPTGKITASASMFPSPLAGGSYDDPYQ